MILTIKDEKLLVSVDTFGGEITSIYKNEKEYLWQGDKAFWGGQSPLLFPIVGHLKDGKIKIRGKEHTMKAHGFIKETELIVSKHTDEEMVLTTSYDEGTLEKYPFKFKFTVSFKIVEGTLDATYEIENLDDEKMPFNFGLHPGFNCSFGDGEAIEEYYVEFPEKKILETAIFNDDIRVQLDVTKKLVDDETRFYFKDELFYRTVIFHDIDFDSIILGHKIKGPIFKFSYSGFHVLALYRAQGAPFICLEPWTGHDAIVQNFENFEENPTVQFLDIGEKRCFKMNITNF
ncbi:MAG: hypothetical protein R3Y47_10360 [Lachnospiraceae bacterium]